MRLSFRTGQVELELDSEILFPHYCVVRLDCCLLNVFLNSLAGFDFNKCIRRKTSKKFLNLIIYMCINCIDDCINTKMPQKMR